MPSQTWKPWKAVVVTDGKARVVGSFRTPEEAAWAYDEAARKAHGAFAQVNGIPFPRRHSRARGELALEGVAVVKRKERTVYRALATVDGKRRHVGYYVTPFDAALAYDDWLVRSGLGTKRRLNYPLIQLGRLGTTAFDDFWPVRA